MELMIALVLFVGIVASWFVLPGAAADGVSHVEQASAPVAVQQTA